ncbi:MAG: amino acid permease [Terracidiphilus sp.]|jgi:amino acid transporter
MTLASATSAATLQRRIGLRSAVAFNMLEMIGVGPFITLPLVIAAAGYRLSVWAWVLGAVIAVADGLVWAELGAAFPKAGGSYAFLREIYGPERAGNWLSFLYVWQLSFTAPLAIASGCIGLSSFLAWFWPGLDRAPLHSWPGALPALHFTNFAAAAACLLVTALLYRNLSSITRLAWVLFAGVMAAIAGVIVSGFARGGWQMPASTTLTLPAALGGLAQATLLTTYCYWGYYNICFLGAEVRRPERTIPRAILLSVLFVAAFYVAMDLAALPSMRDAVAHVSAGEAVRLQLVADIAKSAFGSVAGRIMAALIIWTAFGSVFSLQLGYSRVPYAAAHDGNYFRSLAALHPRHNIPHRSLVALGLVAAGFCFFSLTQVITMLVITRILLQFFLQHVGVILLRIQRPELARPFRMPLYPLPPLIAIAGFVFMLVNRSHALGGLGVAAAIALSGTCIYLIRARRSGQWPFASSPTRPSS